MPTTRSMAEKQNQDILATLLQRMDEQEKRRQEEKDDLREMMQNLEIKRQAEKAEEEKRQEKEQEQERRRQAEKAEGETRRQEELTKILELQKDTIFSATKELKEEIKEDIFLVKEEVKAEVTEVRGEVTVVKEKVSEVEGKVNKVEEKVEAKMSEFQGKVERLERQLRERGGQLVMSSGPRLKPPSYDGLSSWATYKRQFEAAASAHNWTNEEKAMALVLALKCQASDVLQTIPVAQQQDYEVLEAALDLRYGDQHLAQVYQAQLKSRVQKAGESLQEFAAAVETRTSSIPNGTKGVPRTISD